LLLQKIKSPVLRLSARIEFFSINRARFVIAPTLPKFRTCIANDIDQDLYLLLNHLTHP
jgi:hypothetical protein